MSAIALASGPVRSTRLRMTARGRRLLGLIAAIPAVAVLAFAIVGGGAALASREGGAPAGSFETITVMSGDSLWSIAEEVAPTADPRDVVDAITRLNSIDGGVLVAGQQLAIPAEYAPDLASTTP